MRYSRPAATIVPKYRLRTIRQNERSVIDPNCTQPARDPKSRLTTGNSDSRTGALRMIGAAARAGCGADDGRSTAACEKRNLTYATANTTALTAIHVSRFASST